jgi:hypothetical protein
MERLWIREVRRAARRASAPLDDLDQEVVQVLPALYGDVVLRGAGAAPGDGAGDPS